MEVAYDCLRSLYTLNYIKIYKVADCEVGTDHKNRRIPTSLKSIHRCIKCIKYYFLVYI